MRAAASSRRMLKRNRVIGSRGNTNLPTRCFSVKVGARSVRSIVASGNQTPVQRLVLVRDRASAEPAFGFRAARRAIDPGQPSDRVAHLLERVAIESGLPIVDAFRHA